MLQALWQPSILVSSAHIFTSTHLTLHCIMAHIGSLSFSELLCFLGLTEALGEGCNGRIHYCILYCFKSGWAFPKELGSNLLPGITKIVDYFNFVGWEGFFMFHANNILDLRFLSNVFSNGRPKN